MKLEEGAPVYIAPQYLFYPVEIDPEDEFHLEIKDLKKHSAAIENY